MYVPGYAGTSIKETAGSLTGSWKNPTPLHFYSTDIKLLAKKSTFDETTDWINGSSEGTELIWNLRPSTLQQVPHRQMSLERLCTLVCPPWPLLRKS